jgi:hypothetical protein
MKQQMQDDALCHLGYCERIKISFAVVLLALAAVAFGLEPPKGTARTPESVRNLSVPFAKMIRKGQKRIRFSKVLQLRCQLTGKSYG